jgi:hypothetical protein
MVADLPIKNSDQIPHTHQTSKMGKKVNAVEPLMILINGIINFGELI